MVKADSWLRKVEKEIEMAKKEGKISQKVLELVSELRIHQTELEMQNEELKLSQEELFTLYKQYYELYDGVPIGYFTLDENGIIKNVNVKGAELLQLKKSLIIGRGFNQFIQKDSENNYYRSLKNATNTGENQKIELDLKRGKELFYGHMEIMPSINRERENYRLILADITKRQKSEDKILESEKNFRALAENAGEAMLIGTSKGNHVYANPKAAEITGYTIEELLKTSIMDLAHPDKINELMGRYKARLDGETLSVTHETRIIRKDKKNIPIELKASKIIWNGQPAYMALFHDISYQKKAQEELQRANLYNRNLIEASLDLMVTIGLDGKITDVNNATLNVTGCLRDELICADFSNYFTEPEKAREGYRQVFKEGFVRDYPLEIKDKNNHVTPVLYNASLYKDEFGKVAGVFAVARDITERQEAENEQKRLNRELQAIGSCNQAMLRAVDEKTLLNDVCRIICDEAGYRLAWVGYAEHDDYKTIRPVAWAGYNSGYIASAKLSWSKDTERGKGPAGKVIRSGEIIYVQDFTNDSLMAPWRENALQHGYRSGIALPLNDKKSHTFGVLLIYSEKPNVITKDEIKFIDKLSKDLEFGIISLREQEELKIAERELKKASLYNRSLIEASLDPLVTIGLDGKITDVNKATENATGYSKEDLIGTDFLDYFTNPEKAKEGYQKVFKRGFLRDYPLEIKNKNGHIIPVLYNATVYKDEFGDIVGVFAAARDITDIKQFEGIMQARSRLLEFANSHSMDELLTATLDEIEALTGSNIGFYHFLQGDQKTLSLQNWSTNTLKNMCTADGRGSHYDIDQAGVWVDCIYKRRPVIHNNYSSLSHRKGLPEGHSPVNRELTVPIFRDKVITAIIGVGNKSTDYDENDVEIALQLGDLSWDIVERKQAEEKLKEAHATLELKVKKRTEELEKAYKSLSESEAQLKIAMDLAKLVSWQYDVESDMFTFDDHFYALYGTTAEKEGGVQMSSEEYAKKFILSEESYLVAEAIAKATKTDNPDLVENIKHSIIRADGEKRDLIVRFGVIKDDKGRTIKTYGANQDITEQEKAKKELENLINELKRSNEELKQFAYVSSHDLQEPLRTIASFTQLLERRYKNKLDEDADEFLDYIVEAAIRMKQQIQDLLEYSRVVTKGEDFELVDMNSVINQTITVLNASIEESKAEIIIEKLPHVIGDAVQLRRVFQNLISNAIKFRKDEELLKIRIFAYKSEDGKEYVINIKDNGIGIEEQYFERIFTIFQRLHTRDVYDGTGIGLSIVKRIIERHGGHIWVESEYNKGSTFYFTMPYFEE